MTIGGGMMNNDKYWAQRIAATQDAISQKNAKQVAKQLRKYYRTLSQGVIDDFEATLNKVLNAVEQGKKPTPADLYKLDSYWQMQSQLDTELKKLNERQQRQLIKAFKRNYIEVYSAINIDGVEAFNTINTDSIMQVINRIWCADGKTWSQRIWENTALLKQTLNEELVRCVTTGKNPSYLRKLLQERFSVSFSRADSLVRTELSHIQTTAAQQRYIDYGITQVKVLADKDERRCEDCGKLHETVHDIHGVMPVPAHPRCRCCIVPVVKRSQTVDR